MCDKVSTVNIRDVRISNGHKPDGFLSGFRMVFGSHLVFSIQNLDRTFLTASLDRFGKILLLIKQSRLVDHSKTGRRVQFLNSLSHLKTGPFDNWTRIESDKTGRSGFRMLTVFL